MVIKSDMVEVHIVREGMNGYEFLALKRSPDDKYPNIWQMVTGKIEDGEKAYQAALREAEEETGITGGDFFVVPNVSTFYDHFANVLRHVVVFLLMAEEGEEVTLSDEHCEYRWISAAETKELYVWTDQHRSVEAVLHLLDNPDAMNISKIKK